MPQLSTAAVHQLSGQIQRILMEKVGFDEQRSALYERFGRDRAMIPLGEVAAYLGVDRRTLLRDRSFPVRRVGRQYLIPVISLARWLNV